MLQSGAWSVCTGTQCEHGAIDSHKIVISGISDAAFAARGIQKFAMAHLRRGVIGTPVLT
jgi:hypothetical protein